MSAPFLHNPRSDKVHRPGCRYEGRATLKPLAIEATTTFEAYEKIVALGLKPCGYCFRPHETLDPGRRYVFRDLRSNEYEEMDEPFEIVDTETNEVVRAFYSWSQARAMERTWNDAVESDPTMTPRRLEAMRRLREASAAHRWAVQSAVPAAERNWGDAIREMHAAGFSPDEIAAMTGLTDAEVTALLGPD